MNARTGAAMDGDASLRRYSFTFGHYTQTTPWTDARALDWMDLVHQLTKHEIGAKKGTCIVPAIFSGKDRKKAEAIRIDVAFLDSDTGHTLDEIRTALVKHGWQAIISSTHSHMTTRTKAGRGNWDKFRVARADTAELPTQFLLFQGMLPHIAAGAKILEQTDEFSIFEHQACPKFRIALPLARPWLAASYDNQREANAAWKERVEALAAALDLRHDQSCTDTSRLFYLPRRPVDGPIPEISVLTGEHCDIFDLPPAPVPARSGRRATSQKPKPSNARPSGNKAPEGPDTDWGDTTFTDPGNGEIIDLVAWARRAGRSFELRSALQRRLPDLFIAKPADNGKHHIRCVNEAEHTVAGADAATFVVNASESETGGFVYHCRHAHCDGRDRLFFLRRMLEAGWLMVADLADADAATGDRGDDELVAQTELTEHGVALAFVQRYQPNRRYCHTSGSWYFWTGTHWQKNATREAFHDARRLAASLSREADFKTRAITGKASFAGAVERFVKADVRLAVTAKVWDHDPWLLGTPGGTLDLRTGTLREPQRGDHITRLTAVAPDTTSSCPTFLAFLAEATGGDGDLAKFLQRWFGYCLTGVTREHALVFVYGPGGNGKGVLLNTISGIFGANATMAAMETFTAARGERHPTDLAMLQGARLVLTTETEEGRAWAESRIKALTGGDEITARFMRQDFFTFTPNFKLTISGNHKPALRNVDDAARRRFNVVSFPHKPTKPNPLLTEQLRAEWPGILRWMIEGCLDWQREGLSRPKSVLDATAEYFAEQDVLAQWVEDCCEIGPQTGESMAVLFTSWKEYASERAEEPRSAKWFSTMLERQGFRKGKDCQFFRGRGFLSISLRPRSIAGHWQDRD